MIVTVCHISDSRGNRPYYVALTVDCMTVGRWVYSGAEHYRRRGLVAKERAALSTDLSVKEAFKDVARHWLGLPNERIG